MEIDNDGEGFIIDRLASNPLSEAELEEYRGKGWELSYSEPRITFVPGEPVVAGTTARYVFRRIKKQG